MSMLKKPLSFETAFGTYLVNESLGEGGAGRVYGGVDQDNNSIAIKVLTKDKATKEKRSRFKNEIAFLARNTHRNIVSVTDSGIVHESSVDGPFYVMCRYDGSLRKLIKAGISPDRVLPLFSQIFDGVEAAHLQGVVHRDLKPENILYDKEKDTLAIADFGIASLPEDFLVTHVETSLTQRLANFQYAAPEQRTSGKQVTAQADIYALGMMLNEMFTGIVPHGTDYRGIEQVASEFGFLDHMVSMMMRQTPEERPSSIADIKGHIQRYQSEAVSLQRISKIDGTVIKATDIDDPLAESPPNLINFDWNGVLLTLILDRPVTSDWIRAFSSYPVRRSPMGKEPNKFRFQGNIATIPAQKHEIQGIIDYFKTWLPDATRYLKSMLEQTARDQEAHRIAQLQQEREAEMERLSVLRIIKI